MTADEVRQKHGAASTRALSSVRWWRGVLRRLHDGRIAPADFHVRFESWALFEGWQDLPEDIKDRLNRWEMDHYTARHRETVAAIKAGQPRPTEDACPEYLLAGRSGPPVRAHRTILPVAVQLQGHGPRMHPATATCVRFSNARGHRLGNLTERALSIVKEARIGRVSCKAPNWPWTTWAGWMVPSELLQ